MLLKYAEYSPKGQLVWARKHETPRTRQQIDLYRYEQRLDVRRDNNDQLIGGGNTLLHTHFALNQTERSLCYSEALRDIRDAVIVSYRVSSVSVDNSYQHCLDDWRKSGSRCGLYYV